MTSFGIPKITPEGLGTPCRKQAGVDFVGRLRALIEVKALHFLNSRHKKRRPWTSLIDHLVGRGHLNMIAK